MRAAASDLTISISPLGLVELADEEFEVHGPRLNRYANHWAFFLGHHWAYRREIGEPNITVNYVGALSRYLTNFTFGRGIEFSAQKRFEHIIPALLQRAWHVDNDMKTTLYQIGEQGSVSGDSFVKVAYEPAWTDSAGNYHPGRARILPLAAAYSYPEYHPHDKDRLIRFKLKYKFWATSLEGTRSVYSYTEIITDDYVEEYVNDELLDARENPLGTIPIVHIRNIPVSGSPWGLADVSDIISLNREFNEKATEISDIINYHSAPITIITGAKASNLERGANRVWGGLPKDATVSNLGNEVDLVGPLQYLDLIKRGMHEMTGVPETALGQMQAISNTSAAALAVTYQPLMQKFNLKKMVYGFGLRRINELILRSYFLYEPDTLKYDPSTGGAKTDPDQADKLDPQDTAIYDVIIKWPQPLPIDVLVKLNEIQVKMALGLESKRGALRDLGTEFVDEKMGEIFDEKLQEAKEDGALSFIKQQINAVILDATGMLPDGMPEPPPPANGPDEPNAPSGDGGSSGGPLQGMPGTAGQGATSQDNQSVLNELVTLSAGTKLAQTRNPDANTDDNS